MSVRPWQWVSSIVLYIGHVMKQQPIVLKSNDAVKSSILSLPRKAAILRFKDERATWHSLNFEYVTILPTGKSNWQKDKRALSHTTQTFFRNTLDLPTSRAQSFSRARSASGRFFMFSTAKRARERENYRGTRNEKRRTLRKSRHTLNSVANISLWFRRSNTSCISYSVWYI